MRARQSAVLRARLRGVREERSVRETLREWGVGGGEREVERDEGINGRRG